MPRLKIISWAYIIIGFPVVENKYQARRRSILTSVFDRIEMEVQLAGATEAKVLSGIKSLTI